ncbi:MAG: hypothetical protein JJ863_24270 [Deltaproteobacteria bacterium]|nr:hypothetical protein [Deltaproteobacteria bacterium]
MPRFGLALLILAFGCGDDDSPSDGGPDVDAGPVADAAPVDFGARPDLGPGATELWAPQPWEDCEGGGRTLEAGPDDYRDALDTLEPGDTLQLRPGTYERGLPLRVSGESGRCIVIEALDTADRPLFAGSDSFNIVAVHGASWIKVRNLDIDGMGRAGFGVASQGGDDSPTHHVVIDGLTMTGLDSNQQIVGVSTKSPAWDWVIRRNHIERAGTGLYLGNSDGSYPFVRGVIELNTVLDPIGYAMQIKHQNPWPAIDGMPSEPSDTLVRWNVFSKVSSASTDAARPNLLVGHQPSSGPGQDDRVLIYGNFFYDNPTENLLQAEGNLAIYANVFANPNGGAINLQPHNAVPRAVDVFFNTVVSSGRGIRVTGGDAAFEQRVRYNAVFSPMPIAADDTSGDITGDLSAAASMLVNPSGAPGELDLHPVGELSTTLGDDLPTVLHGDRDYDGRLRSGDNAGAYDGPAGAGALPLVRAAQTR